MLSNVLDSIDEVDNTKDGLQNCPVDLIIRCVWLINPRRYQRAQKAIVRGLCKQLKRNP